MPRTRHGPGYYLALTFGTLLSSQGADAQKEDPLGLRLWRLVRLYAVLRIGRTRGSHPAGLPAARRRKDDTPGSGPRAGGPSEAQEALDPHGQARPAGDLAHRQENSRHER